MIQNLTLKYVVIASFVIGVMFTISFGLYGYPYYDIYLHRDTTGGIIEKIDYENGTTSVTYSTGEATIKKIYHFIDSSYKENEYITIYYDTRNPEKSFIYEQISIILFFFCIGIGFLCIFAITYFLYKYGKKNPEKVNKKKSVKVLSKK